MVYEKSALNVEHLYQKYKNDLFKVSFTYLKNTQDCEDVIQEAFIKFFTESKDFESEEHVKRWLIKTTVNLCKNQLALFYNKKRVFVEELDKFEFEDEDREVLISLMNLSIKYRIVVYLYYIEGYKIAEISELLNISESAVKMRLKRSKEKLRIELEGELCESMI